MNGVGSAGETNAAGLLHLTHAVGSARRFATLALDFCADGDEHESHAGSEAELRQAGCEPCRCELRVLAPGNLPNLQQRCANHNRQKHRRRFCGPPPGYRLFAEGTPAGGESAAAAPASGTGTWGLRGCSGHHAEHGD